MKPAWALVPDPDAPVVVAPTTHGAVAGTGAGDAAAGSWSHDAELGLRLQADRGGLRSSFSRMPRRDGDDVVGLEVLIHHQVGDVVGGMQIRLG